MGAESREALPCEEVLQYWFGDELGTSAAVGARSMLWFAGDADFDAGIHERFADLPDLALSGELAEWASAPRSALALVIALDQFPRNLYRGSAKAFEFDGEAARVASLAIERGFDEQLHPVESIFLYLPFEHAEDLSLQQRSVDGVRTLAARADVELAGNFAGFLDYAVRHQRVIEEFGRFPHRNEVLGRSTTAEEASFLSSGGDSFGGEPRKA